jgi:hypothetical protein
MNVSYGIACALFFASCSSDIAIIKRYDEQPGDTSSDVSVDKDSSDPTPEPSDPASEPSSDDMTDLTVGYSEIHFRQIACPPCVGAASEFDITATTQQASFNGITLNPNGQGEWYNGFVYEYQYERNTNYTITSEHGAIPNAFTSIEGFDDIQPYTLLWVDPSYAYDAAISKAGTTFTWFPVVQNSLFEIIVAVYSYDGSQFLGAVSCLEQDTGSMTVPGNYLQQYPSGSIAAVHLIRHRIARVPVPSLNGYLQSHMIWEVVGTGVVQ